MIRTDHAHHFARGEHHVHVLAVARVVDVGDVRLVLLRHAGHDGDVEDLVWIDAHLFGEIGLGDRALHLMGRLGGGQLSGHLGMTRLQEAHPARAAGREHGERVLIPMLHPFEELAALLHDGQVGAIVGVEHVVKAQRLQRGDQTAGRRLFAGQAQFLAPCRAHGGSDLHDGHLVGIVERAAQAQQAMTVVALAQRAHRAVSDALAAQRAVGFGDVLVVGDAHRGPGTGLGHVPDVQALHLVADLDAAHALDALGGIADQREAGRPGVGGQIFGIFGGDDAQIVGDLLQRAVAAAHARCAQAVVLGQDQLHVGAARLAHAGRVGIDVHALLHHVVTGGDELVDALDLHHADTAGADFVDLLEVAEVRDRHVRQFRGAENGGAFLDLERLAVDLDVYHFVSLPPLKMP